METSGPLNRLPLHEWHRSRAQMFEFAGWEMPLQYTGIKEEHMCVRERVGLFDISHMGRLRITGPDAEEKLDRLLTRSVGGMPEGSCRYSCMCNERGGIIDDVVVSRLGKEDFLVVVNAATREKDLAWMERNGIRPEDLTFRTFMFALQGPLSESALGRFAPLPEKRFTLIRVKMLGAELMLSRTGYTGEDGFELIGPREVAAKVWALLLEGGEEFGIQPCGLGARDTLRLEAGYCLYGEDINEDTTPLEARLEWAVNLEKDFIGRESLLRQKEEGLKTVRVGFISEAIPRRGYMLEAEEGQGRVTSGSYSPLLRKGVGMGYISPQCSTPGSRLTLWVRGRGFPATVAEFPFYDPARYGYTRKK